MNIKSFLLDNKSVKQTILKNTFWLILAGGASQGLSFLLTILIAHCLGVEKYGIFSFVFAFVTLFAVVADFGLSTLTIRDVARDKSLARKYIDNIAIIKLILGLVTFGLIVVVIQFLGKSTEVKTLVYLAGIWVIIQSFTQFFRSIFRAFEKMQYEALSKIVYSVLLFSIAGFILWKNLRIKLLIISYIIAALSAFIFTLILVRKNFAKFWGEIDFGFWKKSLKESWPLGIAGITVMLFNHIDKVMLGIMDSDKAVGLYNASYVILEIAISIAIILAQSFFPGLSNLYKSSKQRYYELAKKARKIFYIVSLAIFLIFSLFSHQIIIFLYGSKFYNSILALQILSFTIFPVFINNLYGNLLIIKRKQKIYLYGTLGGLFLNILLNLILIPKYSLYGASFATIVSELFPSILFIYSLQFPNKERLSD